VISVIRVTRSRSIHGLIASLWLSIAVSAAQSPSYDAIANGADRRTQLDAIHAALMEYLAEPPDRGPLSISSSRGQLAENAFGYGPIATIPRPVPPALAAALVTAAQTEDRRARREALFALGSIGTPLTPEQVASVAALMKHEDPATREAAAAVAGRLRLRGAADALIDAINDRDARVKTAAMRAIGQLGDERAVQGLNDQLAYHKRGDLALAAFEGLAGIGHGSSVQTFEVALGDREAAARRLAAEGLGRSGHAASAAPLEAALGKENDAFAQLAMAFALSRLGQPLQHRLVQALRVPRTAPQAFAYLVELAPDSRRTLEPLLRDPDERLRALAGRALERITVESADSNRR
jgi:HEAT repeat protein